MIILLVVISSQISWSQFSSLATLVIVQRTFGPGHSLSNGPTTFALHQQNSKRTPSLSIVLSCVAWETVRMGRWRKGKRMIKTPNTLQQQALLRKHQVPLGRQALNHHQKALHHHRRRRLLVPEHPRKRIENVRIK